jgi:hypothetical protein
MSGAKKTQPKKTGAPPEGRKPRRRKPGGRRPAEENYIFTPAESPQFRNGDDMRTVIDRQAAKQEVRVHRGT